MQSNYKKKREKIHKIYNSKLFLTIRKKYNKNTCCCHTIHTYYLLRTIRKVLTETGSRTTGLLFNVQVLYQLSYHDPTILLSRFGSRLTTQALYGVYSCVSGRQGSHMYVGSYMTPPRERHMMRRPRTMRTG